MSTAVKQFLIWLVVLAGVFSLYLVVNKSIGGPKVQTVSYADVLTKTQAGQVKDVTIEGTTMTGHYVTGEAFRATLANDPQIYTAFRDHGVNVTNKDQNSNVWVNTLISIVPFLLLLGTPCLALLALLFLVRRSRAQQPKST
jgi:cell division protease FtsH